MSRLTFLASLLLALGLAAPAHAALKEGAAAPALTTQGALAGKVLPFDLARALANGPVVLYFYPKAFTQGCTLEAHAFAEAMGDFRAAGASVIARNGKIAMVHSDLDWRDHVRLTLEAVRRLKAGS